MVKKVTLKGHTIVYRGEKIKDPLDGRPCNAPSDHWHKLPTPDNDGIGWIDRANLGGNWWCGCTRKNDIFKWWKKNEFNKHPKGFKVRVLAVPSNLVVKGGVQCVFDRLQAKLVGTLNADGSICLQNNKSQLLSKIRKAQY